MKNSAPGHVLMVQDEAGRWYGLIPSDEEKVKGKLQLVEEAGVFRWESIGANKTQYNKSDVDDSSCNFKIAGWQECGDDRSKLVRIPTDKLLEILRKTEGINDYDPTVCLDAILGSQDGKMVLIKPKDGVILIGKKKKDTENVCWVLEDKNKKTSDDSDKRIFKHTGNIQGVTVPEGATRMRVSCWGAGGSSDGIGTQVTVSGGAGGFAKATFAVTPGTKYKIMVGEGVHNKAGRTFGFGGAGQGTAHQHNGGGLSGVFDGENSVTESSSHRALIIAGGGGAGGQSGGGANATQGGNGGEDGRSGGQDNMRGIDGTGTLYAGNGGGGGGYRGGSGMGLGGKGGTSYIDDSAVSAGTMSEAKYPSTVVPGSSSEDYIAPYGSPGNHGLVVIEFY